MWLQIQKRAPYSRRKRAVEGFPRTRPQRITTTHHGSVAAMTDPLGPGPEMSEELRRAPADDDAIYAEADEARGQRRRKAIAELSGSLTGGVYGLGYLDALRLDWLD